jgi:hypothetical protein
VLASSLRAAGRFARRAGLYRDREDARPATERVDPSQQRRSLEAGAVSELLRIARFKFHQGKVDEFMRLSARCMEIVRTQDTGTLAASTPRAMAVMREFANELRRFATSKGTIRLPIGKPPPATLVKRIVAARTRENEARRGR